MGVQTPKACSEKNIVHLALEFVHMYMYDTIPLGGRHGKLYFGPNSQFLYRNVGKASQYSNLEFNSSGVTCRATTLQLFLQDGSRRLPLLGRARTWRGLTLSSAFWLCTLLELETTRCYRTRLYEVNVNVATKACINASLLFQTAVAFKRSDLQRL